MLKIKDEVDLKELEKFEFIETKEDNEHIDGYEFINAEEMKYEYCLIFDNREIRGCALDKIYDLIKADLVEKIEEE